MDQRRLGNTGLNVSRIGWGTVKLGRNQGVSYPQPVALPSDAQATDIILSMLDLGITLIDTAPAYGLAEARIGAALGARREEVVLSTKVGERFIDGRSVFDFSPAAARTSLHDSLRALRTEAVDLLLVHSDGRDLEIQCDTDLVETLQTLRQEGLARAIGFSGKTIAGARTALGWADVLMCTYNRDDTEHAGIITQAQANGTGIVLKKALGSGHLPADEALDFVLHDSPVADSIASVVVGSSSPQRMRENICRLN